ncbi:MAG: gamma-glutamyl-gamma-aminobutyrate hydrolase family protein [Jatrophihabitans sp.]|uniref:gamma-glutamyl-gamma-aminobutyrate hydrolase family protein n=1 Tax=Jatrophihabitans sp. TaxID=1932789 RepID=UPI003F7EEF84
MPSTPASLPRIGLTVYREAAAWGPWDERADLLPATYADAVVDAGGAPLLLPPASVTREAADAVLDGVHGLVLTGGADVDPERYGARRHERTGPPRADRDGWEIALAHAALDRGMPLLAICRGLQVLNVALGGTLHQHLPDIVGHDGHCPVVGAHARHDVRIEPHSRLASAVGTAASVPTHHHQAVAALAPSLTAVAWADDGTVEAAERPDGPWVVGVQWHPEVADGRPLFAAFVAACRAAMIDTRPDRLQPVPAGVDHGMRAA